MKITREKTKRGGYVRILSGSDDGSEFRVQIPTRCRTVKQAVAWLRPARIREDALRQGQFFFLPVKLPEGNDYPVRTPRPAPHWRTHCKYDARFSATHVATECIAVWNSGTPRFLGRGRLHGHHWTGHPRYFVRGEVTHAKHAPLSLGTTWHEVIPNRAHGPFPIRGFGRED